jgi:hypothetical protein
MTVKVALLKSGEQVICDIKEMISEERTIGYFFEFPYVVNLRSPELVLDKDPDSPLQLEISLFSWLPLSKDYRVPVPTDWVVTIFEPTKKLKDMYDNILNKLTQNTQNTKKLEIKKQEVTVDDKVDSSSEQPGSDKSD